MSEIEEPSERIGFWGLGAMGAPMARRLVAAGCRVAAFDPRAAAVADFVEDGGEAGSNETELSICVLMLPDSSVVEQVLSSLRGKTLRPGTLIVDMSSSDPVRTRLLAQTLDARGLRLVDAPVSGGTQGAISGSLTIMAGGDPADVDRARPLLDILGRTTHVGTVGSGHAVKALNNLMSAVHLWASSEAIVAGEKFGLEPSVLLDVVNHSSGRSGSTEVKWPQFVLPGGFDSGFALRLMLKDMRIAVGLAESLDVPTPLARAAVEQWSDAADSLATTADHTEVAALISQRAGVERPEISRM